MAATKKTVARTKPAPSNKTVTAPKKAGAKKATPVKKLGLESSETRNTIIDVTEQLIREEGFAAITSRIIAAKAGLKPPLIHYYFHSVDDLYVEVFRRGAEADLARLTAALEADQPLRAMWALSSDPKATRFVTEFMALANHNQAVRAEISVLAEKRREIQAEIISRHLTARGVRPRIPPIVLAVLIENVARGLVLESALDVSLGHEETDAFLEACLRRLDESGDASLDAEGLNSPKGPPGARSKIEQVLKRATRRRG